MSLSDITENPNNIKSADRCDELMMNYINKNNITNLAELYSVLITTYFQVYCTYGRINIYHISKEGSNSAENIYSLNFIEYINKTSAQVKIGESKLIAHPDLVFLVMVKKLSNYKLVEGINYYSCDIKNIENVFKSTINEFTTISLIDLITKYNIEDAKIKMLKSRLSNTLKYFILKCSKTRCVKCVENLPDIESIDVCNLYKMLTLSKCCTTYQITDIIPTNFQMEITI